MRIIIASFFVCFQSFGQSNYWQQEVDYQINVTIDDTKDKAFGEETLIYQNNSPDTLKELYFHLYGCRTCTASSVLHSRGRSVLRAEPSFVG